MAGARSLTLWCVDTPNQLKNLTEEQIFYLLITFVFVGGLLPLLLLV